jgi:thiamine kinase-like enzyme
MNVNSAKKLVNKLGPRWPKPVSILGKGANGAIYTTNSGKLLKVVHEINPQEYNSLLALKNTKFVPKVYNRAYVNDYTVFTMNKVGRNSNMVVTLDNFRNYVKNNKNVPKQLSQMVSNMHRRGISHGDLHGGNILVSFKPGNPSRYKLWFIDFGRSTVLPMGFTESNFFNVHGVKHDEFERISGFSKKRKVLPVFSTGPTNLGGKTRNTNMVNLHGSNLKRSRENTIANTRYALSRYINERTKRAKR